MCFDNTSPRWPSGNIRGRFDLIFRRASSTSPHIQALIFNLPDNPEAAQSGFMPEPSKNQAVLRSTSGSVGISESNILQFVTVCADKRRPLLARPDVVALLLDCWRKADHWLVGRYVIMPDICIFSVRPRNHRSRR